MKCPFCDEPDTKVIDSRPTEEGRAIRRRRECPACGKRFTTYEKVEEMLFMVVKRDGRRECDEERDEALCRRCLAGGAGGRGCHGGPPFFRRNGGVFSYAALWQAARPV